LRWPSSGVGGRVVSNSGCITCALSARLSVLSSSPWQPVVRNTCLLRRSSFFVVVFVGSSCCTLPTSNLSFSSHLYKVAFSTVLPLGFRSFPAAHVYRHRLIAIVVIGIICFIYLDFNCAMFSAEEHFVF